MNENSQAILLYCSHLACGENVAPLESKEWSELSGLLLEKNLTPSELLDCSEDELCARLGVGREFAQRLVRLTDRGASLAFELEKYANIGIRTVTRADGDYPAKLKRSLGNRCPPLFYYAGDLQLVRRPAMGYVGSRNADDAARDFTARTVEKTVGHGYGVVSGGAKGVDSVAKVTALEQGAFAVEYLAEPMTRRLKSGQAIRAIQSGTLLLLTAANPDAGFHVGNAMMRNRLIYAQSEGTVVVRADLNTGGTWAGATENLANGWCREFCWKNARYPGNIALIGRGATPIDERWDGDPGSLPAQPQSVQTSLFD